MTSRYQAIPPSRTTSCANERLAENLAGGLVYVVLPTLTLAMLVSLSYLPVLEKLNQGQEAFFHQPIPVWNETCADFFNALFNRTDLGPCGSYTLLESTHNQTRSKSIFEHCPSSWCVTDPEKGRYLTLALLIWSCLLICAFGSITKPLKQYKDNLAERLKSCCGLWDQHTPDDKELKEVTGPSHTP